MGKTVKYNINELRELITRDLKEKGQDISNVNVVLIQVAAIGFAPQTKPKSIDMGAGSVLNILVETIH